MDRELHVRPVLKALAILLSAVGLGGSFLAVLGLMDPRSAQLSNDSDPFGVAPSFGQLLLLLGVSVAILLTGVWLLRVIAVSRLSSQRTSASGRKRTLG